MNFLEQTCQKIFPQDSQTRDEAAARLNQRSQTHLTLGALMDLAVDLAGMTRTLKPQFARKALVLMAGDHGVAVEGVSMFAPEIASGMIPAFVAGKAGSNSLAMHARADVFIVDMGVNADLDDLVTAGKIIDKKVGHGTNNITRGPAMSAARARQAVEAGIEVADLLCQDYTLLGTGNIGTGSTTAGAAITAILTGTDNEEATRVGSTPEDDRIAARCTCMKKILQVNKPDKNNGLDVLSRVGGFEIGGTAGLIIGAAAKRVPVVIDGFTSTAGALIACKIEPFVRDYLIFAQRSRDPRHRAIQEALGCRKGLLDLNIHGDEGGGAAVAMTLVEAAAAVLTEITEGENAAAARSARNAGTEMR